MELPDGVRVVTRLVVAAGHELRFGAPVEAVADTVAEETEGALVTWAFTLAAAGSAREPAANEERPWA